MMLLSPRMMLSVLFPRRSLRSGCQIIHLLLTPSPAPYTFDKFDSSPDRQMSPLCGPAPDPVCRHIKGGIQMTNSCHLLWYYVTWWHPGPCHQWQTPQWCGSWDSVNWKWEIKSWISQWIYVSKFWRIILFLNVWWRKTDLKMFPDRKMKW